MEFVEPARVTRVEFVLFSSFQSHQFGHQRVNCSPHSFAAEFCILLHLSYVLPTIKTALYAITVAMFFFAECMRARVPS